MTLRLIISDAANEDILFHKRSGNKSVLSKILMLFEELVNHPFTGTGKPEPLKYNFSGMWSRRINHEHRLVYKVDGQIVTVLSARGHYD